jgi:hypothetical protein
MGSSTKTTRAVLAFLGFGGSGSGTSGGTGGSGGSGGSSLPTKTIPLQSYLDKYHASFNSMLIPTTLPARDTDVPPDGYKRIPISLHPLLATAVSPYYAGKFDDDMDFSASLVKIAALFAACRMLTAAKVAVKAAATVPAFFTAFNAALKAEIDTHADPRIRTTTFKTTQAARLYPTTAQMLRPTGVGTAAATVVITDTYKANQRDMIVNSGDATAAAVIDTLGYGYISASMKEEKFFDPAANVTGLGIWLAGDYANGTYVRIPCLNDHDDAQLATTRQVCRMFALLRLDQLPSIDSDAQTLMRDLLNEPKPGGTVPWLDPSRVTVGPQFSVVMDKIGFAGLGASNKPDVFSEGLVIKWNDTSQVTGFNSKIDASGSSPSTHLTGEIAVSWQNLLKDNLDDGFDGIVEIINNSVSDFLDQAAL